MSSTSIYNEGSECQIFQTSSLPFFLFFFVIVHLFHFDLQRKSVRASCFNHPCVLCSFSICYPFVIGLLFHFDLQRKLVRARLFNHPCVLCSLSICYLFVIGLLFHFDLQRKSVRDVSIIRVYCAHCPFVIFL